MSRPELVDASLGEVPQMEAVMLAAMPAEHGERWRRSDLTTMLGMPGSGAMLLRQQGQALAFALWRSALDEAELLLLGVVPEAQRRGHARRLLAGMEDHLVRSGIRTLFLEVRETNAAALALYHGWGFSLAGRRPRYYLAQNGTRTDALTLRRQLVAEAHVN